MMQTFIWSEDSDYAAFRLSVRNFLARQTELNTVREREERRGPYDRGLWQQFCETFELADLMAVPRTGGSPDYRALSIIAEELGRSLLPCPFLSTIALAVPLACLFNSSGQLDSLIEDMVIGKVVVSVAFQETALELSIPDDIHATFREEAGRYFISGRKISVLDGGTANAFFVIARREDRVELFLVERNAPGISVEEALSLDLSQDVANVVFQDVSAKRLEDQNGSWLLFVEAQSIAAALVAAEQIGGAERCVEIALDYVKERHQFGRAVGSFQSVKHDCANMAIGLVMARAALESVLRVAGPEGDGWLAAISNLRWVASEEYSRIAEENLQLHGGLGFTWENDCHLYLRRAKFCEVLLGGPDQHREALVHFLGI